MARWTDFTDNEISQIKHKLTEKFERALIVTLAVSPLICMLAPYIPGKKRRGGKRMIDSMDYEDAVIQFTIMWIFMLIVVWIWNSYKTRKEFNEIRIQLSKDQIVATVKKKEKTLFKSFENRLITDQKGDLRVIELDRDESVQFNTGDKIQIEIEVQTNTILRIQKYKLETS